MPRTLDGSWSLELACVAEAFALRARLISGQWALYMSVMFCSCTAREDAGKACGRLRVWEAGMEREVSTLQELGYGSYKVPVPWEC